MVNSFGRYLVNKLSFSFSVIIVYVMLIEACSYSSGLTILIIPVGQRTPLKLKSSAGFLTYSPFHVNFDPFFFLFFSLVAPPPLMHATPLSQPPHYLFKTSYLKIILARHNKITLFTRKNKIKFQDQY